MLPAMKPVLVLRHVPHESLGSLEEYLARAGVGWRYLDWFTPESASASFDPAEWAALVVLGGPMNVDEIDRYPFLKTEVAWLQRALAAELPVLGICLGSQLLAKALGARVYANRVKEIGWYSVETTDAATDDRLFAGSSRRETVFQWHGDTFDLPPGAVQLARGQACEQQAFRQGTAHGLQFHVEVTPAIVEQWLAEPGNCGELSTLDYIDPAAIRRDMPERLPEMQSLADRLLGRFAELCRQRGAALH
jgi:GMP synthase (glutamine-hydrolysing)